jgi:hypothetical protein
VLPLMEFPRPCLHDRGYLIDTDRLIRNSRARVKILGGLCNAVSKLCGAMIDFDHT